MIESENLDATMQRLSTEIYALAGKPFNINSPQQLSKVLFDDMNLPAPFKAGKGKVVSTAADVLETLEPLENLFGRVEETLLRDAVYEWMPYACATDVLSHAEPLAVLPVTSLGVEEGPAPRLRLAS